MTLVSNKKHISYLTDSQTLGSQLSNMLENQKIESVKPKEKSREEIERKEAILAQYSQVSDEEYPFLNEFGFCCCCQGFDCFTIYTVTLCINFKGTSCDST